MADTGAPTVTPEQIRRALRDVIDPELRMSIVDLDMVRDIAVADGRVRVDVMLTIGGCPLREVIADAVRARLRALPGIRQVEVTLGVMTPEQREALVRRLRGGGAATAAVPSFLSPGSRTCVLSIASGKGGVGKSTVTVNLAAALARLGYAVGVLDADVYGFSIPKMLGMHGRPTMIDQMILPLERDGIRVISMGFLLPDDEEAIIWRGPLLHQALLTFIHEVRWGDDLDYLLIDLPPGTGDVALTIAQTLPEGTTLLVTTPQAAAVQVARRVARMADKVNTTIAGVVENMAYYRPAPDAAPVYVFGEGGGEALAGQLGVPLIGRIPLDPAVREAGDRGQPVVLVAPENHAARAFRQVADRICEIMPAGASRRWIPGERG